MTTYCGNMALIAITRKQPPLADEGQFGICGIYDGQCIACENVDLRAEVDALMKSRITWIKCIDSLPPDEIDALVAYREGKVDKVRAGFKIGDFWYVSGGYPLSHWDSVTHWADLPAHPEKT